jgi:hypothetical protein
MFNIIVYFNIQKQLVCYLALMYLDDLVHLLSMKNVLTNTL